MNSDHFCAQARRFAVLTTRNFLAMLWLLAAQKHN